MEVSVRVIDSSLSERQQCIFVEGSDTLLFEIRQQLMQDGLDLPETFVFVTKNGNQITKQQEKQLKFSSIYKEENGVQTILIKSTNSSIGTILGSKGSSGVNMTGIASTQLDSVTNRVAQVPVKTEELLTISTSEGKTFLVRVGPKDKIKDVKRKIFEEKGIPTSEQELYCNGMPLEDQTDARVVKPEMIINLIKKTKKIKLILETPTGRRLALKLNPDVSIKKIKSLAAMHIGVKEDDIRLILGCNYKLLEVGHTLAYYKIQNDAIIHVGLALKGS